MADPVAMFQTNDIAGVLAGISVTTGLNVTSGTITIPYRKRVSGGTYASGSNHYTLAATNGLTIIESIQVADSAEATASLKTVFISTDGFTVPVTENTGAALSNQTFNAVHALGTVVIDGTAVTDVQSVTINTGINLVPYRVGGAVYPTQIFITARDPYIDLVFKDHNAMAGQGPLFEAATSAVIGLRKRSDGGTFVADGTAEHCTITSSTGIKLVQNISSTTDDTQNTLRIYCKGLSSSATATL
jgi:hypothetical protein